MTPPKTLYDELGLTAFADDAAIKSAYRKLARQYHPDLNPANRQAAEARFKAINEAYNTLSTPAKKKAYDEALKVTLHKTHPPGPGQQQQEKPQAQPKPAAPKPPPTGARPNKPETASKASAAGAAQTGPAQKPSGTSGSSATPNQKPEAPDKNKASTQGNGQNATAQPPEPKPEASGRTNQANQANQSSPSLQDVFRAFWQSQPPPPQKRPSGFAPQREHAPSQSAQRGRDISAEITLEDEEAQKGCQKTISIQNGPPCQHCAASGKLNGLVCGKCHGERYVLKPVKLNVKLPAGLTHGAKVRIASQGLPGIAGGATGDLFIVVSLAEHLKKQAAQKTKPTNDHASQTADAKANLNSSYQQAKTQGLDVYANFSIAPHLAVLGGKFTLPAPQGKVEMTIPPLSASGKVFKLKGQGIKEGATCGDLFVKIIITPPEKLSPEAKKLYETLRDLDQ
ncbi:MAG: DnaJ C-terminal domain-containing protein [Vampirovibrionales bacterium]|nr:DnaJ C-terminal domain-containing protein [Vampirovibrionales bacterium]